MKVINSIVHFFNTKMRFCVKVKPRSRTFSTPRLPVVFTFHFHRWSNLVVVVVVVIVVRLLLGYKSSLGAWSMEQLPST